MILSGEYWVDCWWWC